MKYDNSKVRRQDRLLDEARAREILASAEYGILSMIDLDGKPYGVPLNFVWDGDDAIYIHCAPEGKKIDILECHDRVSFCVVGDVNLKPSQFTTEYESVILDCEATICTSEEERVYALELLLRKLSPHDVEIGMKYALKSLHRTCIVRLDILTWSGKAKRVKR
ncbi:MAG: pyridoxamine 5'-phosphate oxidase family protein [Muribaculaceae bacterium]|nr:pyridoxamine 5'-phosphate oxidase family protein [Muribaculaceae bacterium]